MNFIWYNITFKSNVQRISNGYLGMVITWCLQLGGIPHFIPRDSTAGYIPWHQIAFLANSSPFQIALGLNPDMSCICCPCFGTCPYSSLTSSTIFAGLPGSRHTKKCEKPARNVDHVPNGSFPTVFHVFFHIFANVYPRVSLSPSSHHQGLSAPQEHCARLIICAVPRFDHPDAFRKMEISWESQKPYLVGGFNPSEKY